MPSIPSYLTTDWVLNIKEYMNRKILPAISIAKAKRPPKEIKNKT